MSYKINLPPPLTVSVISLSLSPDKSRVHEIYLSIYSQFDLTKNTFISQDNFVFRAGKGEDHAIEIQGTANSSYYLKEFDSEYQMFIHFENYFYNADPDVILGHEILSSNLEFYFKRGQ